MTEPTLKSELSQLFFTTIEMDSIPFYKIIAVCSASCFSVHGNGRLWASEHSSPWSM